MNAKLLILLIVVFILVCESDAWIGGRRRRWIRRICRTVCPLSCTYTCTKKTGAGLVCGYACRPVCKTLCGRKRDANENAAEQDPAKPSSVKTTFIQVPLPAKFSDYDINGDGRISHEEFIKALPPVKEQKPYRDEFASIDKNGDKFFDCKEFLGSDLNRKKLEAC